MLPTSCLTPLGWNKPASLENSKEGPGQRRKATFLLITLLLVLVEIICTRQNGKNHSKLHPRLESSGSNSFCYAPLLSIKTSAAACFNPTRSCSTLIAGPPPSVPFAQLLAALSSWGGLTNRSESYWETLGDQVGLVSSSNEYSSLSCHFPLRAKPHSQPHTLSSNWDFTVSTDGVYSTFFIPYGSTRALHKIRTPVGLAEKQKHSFTARNRP